MKRGKKCSTSVFLAWFSSLFAERRCLANSVMKLDAAVKAFIRSTLNNFLIISHYEHYFNSINSLRHHQLYFKGLLNEYISLGENGKIYT